MTSRGQKTGKKARPTQKHIFIIRVNQNKAMTLEGVREKQHGTGNQTPSTRGALGATVFPIPRAMLCNLEFYTQQWPQEAQMKTLSDPQVWTPFIRKLLENIPLNEINQGRQNHSSGNGGPKAGEKEREAPNDGEGDREGSWALSWAARTEEPGTRRSCCQEMTTYLSGRFPCFKRYTFWKSLGINETLCTEN